MSSIISSILASPNASSSTRFFNENSGQACWTTANVRHIEIVNESENSEVPLSTQQVNETSVYQSLLATDVETVKIIRPTRIRVSMIAADMSLIDNVKASFADPTQTIQVTSKSIIATSMSVVHVGIDMEPGMLSANRLTVLMEQVQLAQTSNYNPLQAADRPTVNLGVQTLQTVGPSLSATIGNNAASLVSTATTAVGSLYQRVTANLGL